MPVISVLNGISIKMYFQQEEHNPPHIHAIYGNASVIIYINGDKPNEGNLSPSQMHELEQWVRNHKDELLTMWNTQKFYKIN